MRESFDVFISYSRSTSEKLAVDVEHRLIRLAKPWHQLRAVRVFRDDSAMAANHALWPTIQSGLAQSRWLILLATPEAARSTYVNQELSEWLRLRGNADQVLLVRAGGTISWDRSTSGRTGNGDFHPSSTAIPPALRNAYRFEPRWVDLAWFDSPGSIGESDPRFVDCIADLSAPIRGIEKAQLIGEDVRQHKKTRRLAGLVIAGLVALLVIALTAGLLALVQRSNAIEQRDLASDQSLVARSRQLASTAVDRSSTDAQSALLLATTAYASRPEPQTAGALHRVLTSSPQLEGFYDLGTPVTLVDGTADSKTLFAATQSGKVFAISRDRGERKELFDIGLPVDYLAATDDGQVVVASGSTKNAEGWQRISSTSKLWKDGNVTDLPQRAVALSPSGKTVVLRSDQKPMEETVSIWTADKSLQSAPSRTSWITLPDDETVVGLDEYGTVVRTSITSGKTETSRIPMGLHMFGGSLAYSGNRFTFIRGGDELEVWEFGTELPASYGQAPLVATTKSSVTGSVGLNNNGTRLATMGDGVIYVSEVVRRGESPEIVVLNGAGSDATAVRFISESRLVNVTGNSVALWDLDADTSMASTLDSVLPGDCNACAAAPVVVSPNGSKVAVNPSNGFVTIANFDTRYTKTWSIQDESEVGEIFDSKPNMVWLDDDRLLVSSSEASKSWILGGDHVDDVLHTGDYIAFSQARHRDDGTVLIVADGQLKILDPETETTEKIRDSVAALSPDGRYGLDIKRTETTTKVVVFDTASSDTLWERNFAGEIVPFIARQSDGFSLMRASGDASQETVNELIRVGISGDWAHTIAKLDVPPSGQLVATDDALFIEGRGEILRYSLTDGSRISLLTTLSSPAAKNALGVSSNGQLVVASEPAAKFFRIPVSTTAWVKRACTLADRNLETADIRGVLEVTDRLKPGCGEAMPKTE